MENSNTTMDGQSKKELINEVVTGRKITPLRVARFALAALICGAAFGAAAALSYGAVRALSDSVSQEAHGNNESNTSDNASGSDAENVNTDENTDIDGSDNVDTNIDGNASNRGSDSDDSSSASNVSGTGSDSSESNDSGNSQNNDAAMTAGTALLDVNSAEFKNAVLKLQADAAEAVDPALVSITATAHTGTWFDSEMESNDIYSGIILSIDESEILILTPYIDASDRTLKVSFCNGSSADAQLKQSSGSDGLSIIAVSAADGISTDTLDNISAVHYADPDSLKIGDAVIAVGSPLGAAGSSTFGNIGYIDAAEPGIDCSQLVMYADIMCNAEKGSFVISYNGELVGIVSGTESDMSEGYSVLSRIISIGSLDRTLRSLMAGNNRAYLGIIGADVSFDMKYSSIPEGVYVSEVLNGSPAYNAGIRHGDVITGIGERKVTDLSSLARDLTGMKPGVTAAVHLMRGSVNSEYKELEFELTLGER